MNVGPTSEGVIPPPSVERLAEVGKWAKANGESIYTTSASPFPYTLPWGVITTRPGRIYLHVFSGPDKADSPFGRGKDLTVYGLQSKVQRAYLLSNHAALKVAQNPKSEREYPWLRVGLPAESPDSSDSVIALEIAGNAEVDPMLQEQPDKSVTLPAYLGSLHKAPNSGTRPDSRGVMERWTNAQDWIGWNFKVRDGGKYNVELITSQQKYGNGWDGGQRVMVQVGEQKLSTVLIDNGKEDNPANPYWPYVISRLGSVQLNKAGKYSIALRPQAIPEGQKYGLTLVSVRLVPAK